MGTPVLQNPVTPSLCPDGHSALMWCRRRREQCLSTGAKQVQGGRGYSHLLPKLGSVLMGFVFFPSISKAIIWTFFFFIEGEVIRILFLYSIEKKIHFVLSDFTISTAVRGCLGSTRMTALAGAKGVRPQGSGLQAPADTLLPTAGDSGQGSSYSAHS